MNKPKNNNLKLFFLLLLLFLCALTYVSGCRHNDNPKSSDNPGYLPQGSIQNGEFTSNATQNKDVFIYGNGTFINEIDISGLTEAEAMESISNIETQLIEDYACNLYLNDMHYTISSHDLTLKSNLMEVLNEAKLNSGSYSLTVFPVDDSKLDTAINEISKNVNTAPQQESLAVLNNTEISGSRFRIIESSSGKELDIQSVKQLILSGERSIELPIIEIAPINGKITIPVLRGSCETEYSTWNKNRSHNVEKAASILNGMVLAPSCELSFDESLGLRNKENGWKKAEAFTNGGLDSEEQYGGGICQVSSTLYNAALKSDLSVPVRCNHSKPVPYISEGLDAAISEGSMDLIIKNTTESDIYIFMWTSEGKLHCEIYGEKFDDAFDCIKLTIKYIDSIQPDAPEFYEDYELSYGETMLVSPAVVGSIYETFKVYYDGNKEVRRERVGESRYRSHPAVYAVGMKR